MAQRKNPFKRHRFPCKIILLAVRWYCRYPLSCRDVRDLLTFSPWLLRVPGFCLIFTPRWLRCARNPLLSNHPKLSHWR